VAAVVAEAAAGVSSWPVRRRPDPLEDAVAADNELRATGIRLNSPGTTPISTPND